MTSERQPRLKQRLLVLGLACGLAFVAQAAFASIASAEPPFGGGVKIPCTDLGGGPCSVSGTKFHDLDGNGAKDPGEPGLEGWVFWADYNRDGVKDDGEHFGTSNASGHYTISDINCLLCDILFSPVDILEVQQSGWTCTYPSPCKWAQVAFSYDNWDVTGKDFGNRRVKGKIRLVKETHPDGDPQQFTFTGDLPGTIGDGEQLPTPPPDFKEVDPGPYSATEEVPEGWDLTSIECSDQEDAQGASTTEDSTATFNVQAGEEITCTFLNTKDGEVIIEKQTVPDGAGEQFSFTGDAPIGAFLLSDDQQKSQPVAPGTYLVSEADPSGLGALGFDLTGLSCDDGASGQPSTTSLGTRTATINVDPGETVKCVFTNTQKSPPETPPEGTPPSTTTSGGGSPSGSGQKAVTGTASFSAPTGCAGGKFRVSVRGTGIARVMFYLDGKKLKTVRKRGSSNRFTISIDGRKLPVGGHRLTAKVKFVPASPTKSKTLKRTVQRCGAAQPKFTG
ncbi:MAG: hypothetical protein WDZ37_04385 [Solirubrobacterales bacterium]